MHHTARKREKAQTSLLYELLYHMHRSEIAGLQKGQATDSSSALWLCWPYIAPP